MNGPHGEDRRRSERYSLGLRILFRRDDTAYFLDTETVNVSIDGAFVSTRRKPLDEGTKVALIFNDLEGFDSRTIVRGVVTRVRVDASEDEPRGMGIRFEGLENGEREQLQSALEQRAG